MDSLDKSPKYSNGASTKVAEELKRITSIGFPMMAVSLVEYLKNMILVASMGRLGSLELAGGSLAIGFTNITGYSVLSGLAFGMEPLCSQAFGSKNYALVHTTLQRMILLLLVSSFPIGLLWSCLEPIMLFLHQNPDITRVASFYCRFAIPDLVAISLLVPMRIYLRSRGLTWPLMWCSLLGILFHIPITIFMSSISPGVTGIAISASITSFNTLFFVVVYIMFFLQTPEKSLSTEMESSSPQQITSSTSREEWKMLLRLVIPSCLGVCLEWWWYEFMTILTGYLPNPQAALATAGIVIQTTALMYILPASLSAVVSTRVGNELGAGKPSEARLAAVVSVGIALGTSMVGFLWTTLGREAWIRVFTRDSETLELAMIVLPVVGVCELANCPQTTCCGILRGSARPGIGATINFYSFYLVGAPVAVTLGFVWKLGFVGLTYGLLAAQVSCVVSMLMVVYKTDWERESLRANVLVARKSYIELGEDVRLLSEKDDERRKGEQRIEQFI